MEIKALGYVGIGTSQTESWSAFATDLLGMQLVDSVAGTRSFRMDNYKQRLVTEPADTEKLNFIGWEVDCCDDLSKLASRLDSVGVAVNEGSAELTAQRCVSRLLFFKDPAGNRHEAFCGPEMSGEPFVPGRPISGFRTGSLGMGHVVLDVSNIDILLPFYRDLLGFRVSDYGLEPYKLYFFHLNGRHHSFAMVEGGRNQIHHIMIELAHIDDVGQGYDLASIEKDRLAYTLGRHTNDHVMSFYSHTPSGFFMEYGWGGRVIDPDTWEPHQMFDGPSLWGHDRLYMEAGPRERLQGMRLDAAARGVRAPLAAGCFASDTVIGRE